MVLKSDAIPEWPGYYHNVVTYPPNKIKLRSEDYQILAYIYLDSWPDEEFNLNTT
jgi:hypothetical protein